MSIKMEVPVNDFMFMLRTTFNKHVSAEGVSIYWRECILANGMTHGEQGYLWVWEDGTTFHSYQTPENQ